MHGEKTQIFWVGSAVTPTAVWYIGTLRSSYDRVAANKQPNKYDEWVWVGKVKTHWWGTGLKLRFINYSCFKNRALIWLFQRKIINLHRFLSVFSALCGDRSQFDWIHLLQQWNFNHKCKSHWWEPYWREDRSRSMVYALHLHLLCLLLQPHPHLGLKLRGTPHHTTHHSSGAFYWGRWSFSPLWRLQL